MGEPLHMRPADQPGQGWPNGDYLRCLSQCDRRFNFLHDQIPSQSEPKRTVLGHGDHGRRPHFDQLKVVAQLKRAPGLGRSKEIFEQVQRLFKVIPLDHKVAALPNRGSASGLEQRLAGQPESGVSTWPASFAIGFRTHHLAKPWVCGPLLFSGNAGSAQPFFLGASSRSAGQFRRQRHRKIDVEVSQILVLFRRSGCCSILTTSNQPGATLPWPG